jgi:phosphate transport system protein
MAEEHRTDYREDLDALRADVLRLGAMACETIGRGTGALLSRDLHASQDLIDADDAIDDLSLRVEEGCYRLLALQSPVAGDLRFVICSVHMSSELERTADLMVNVCKAARRLYDVDVDARLRGLIDGMSREAHSLTTMALDAYADADAALGSALDDMDNRLDDLHLDFVEAIFDAHHTSGLELRSAVQLAMIGRYYERIGDHAVNMGERVGYMVTGWLPEHTAVARMDLRRRQAGPQDGTAPAPPPGP